MSNGGPASTEQLLLAWRSIQSLKQQLQQLARDSTDRAHFFPEFLRKLCGSVNAVAAAVWARDSEGAWKLLEHNQLHVLSGSLQADAHQEFLTTVADAQQARVLPPGRHSHEHSANPTSCVLMAASVCDAHSQTRFVVELFEKPGRAKKVYEGRAQFLAEICNLVADFENRLAMRTTAGQRDMATWFQGFASQVHGQLDLVAICYAIANEGRRLIGCDRLSVAVGRRSRYEVQGISGQVQFDRRSDAVRALNALCQVVAETREPIRYYGDADQLAPQVKDAVQQYVSIAGNQLLIVLPLQVADTDANENGSQQDQFPLLGILVAEQFVSDELSLPARSRLEIVSHHAALALRNALEHQSLFLMPLWKWLGNTVVVRRSRRLSRRASVGLMAPVICMFLWLVPADFALEADGTLEPVQRQNVFAATAGVVRSVYVQHGDEVPAGAPLAKLENVDLEVEYARLNGERATAEERLSAVHASLLQGNRLEESERSRLAGEEAQIRQRLTSLKLQLELCEQRMKQLSIVSPIGGEITTWDVYNRLINRPVQPGQLLLTVARTDGDWEMLAKLPEVRVGHVVDALREAQGRPLGVTIMFNSEPGREYHGELVEIHGRAEDDPHEGSTVLLRITFDKSQVKHPRPGAAALVKVHCGHRSLGYVWFHDVWEFIESRVLF